MICSPAGIRNLFLRVVKNAFAAVGFFVGNHSTAAIILPILLTSASCIGLLNIRLSNDIKDGYTSANAPSRHEEVIWSTFAQRGGSKPYVSGVFVKEKNKSNSSMIRNVANLDATVDLLHHIKHKIRVGQWNQWSFSQVCGAHCQFNEPLTILRESMHVLDRHPSKMLFNVTYPQTIVAGRRVNMAMNVYGVKMVGGTHVIHDAELLALWFKADCNNKTTELILDEFENNLLQFINEYNEDDQHTLELVPMADHMVNEEVIRGSVSTMPFFLGGFISMAAFVIITLEWSNLMQCKLDYGMFIVCVAALISPCMASVTAIGLTLLLGTPINVIMLVVHILVLAIGVDDAFLLVQSWRKHKTVAYVTGQEMSTASEYGTYRLSLTFAHVGVSVTITSVTDVLAFLAGALMPVDEVRRFCLVAAGAIALDWLYQLTFFPAVMKLACQWRDFSELQQSTGLHLARAEVKDPKVPLPIKLYTFWLFSWSARVLWLIIVICHVTAAVLGVVRIRADMDPTSLVPQDSVLAKSHAINQRYVLAEYNPIMLIIQPVPDMRQGASYRRISTLVRTFESLPKSLGRAGTRLWLNDFLKWEGGGDVRNGRFVNIDKLPQFLEMPEYAHWGDTIIWHYLADTHHVVVDGMYVVLAYRGLSTIGEQAELIIQLRQLAELDKTLHATIYTRNGAIVDVIGMVEKVTFQAMLATIASMGFVCIVFIAHPVLIMVALMNVASICTGVVGYLHWWGVALDPITMAFSIMAVGFSVNYAAPMCYQFVTTDSTKPATKRIASTLHTIGVPMMQSGVSTVLCLLAQWYSQLMAFQILVKTIALVVGLGLLHGLFILPVMLAILFDGQSNTDEETLVLEPRKDTIELIAK